MSPTSPVIVNVSAAGCRPFPALLWAGRVLALAHWAERGLPALCGLDDMACLLQRWASLDVILQALCGDAATPDAIVAQGTPLGALRVHAPLAPRQVYCTIGNYRCQWIEAALDADDGPAGPQAPARRAAAEAAIGSRQRTGEPYVCLKAPASVAGPADALPVPPEQATLDWEVEIGVVIGRPAWQVTPERALQFVAGYCVVNDITLREKIFRQDPKLLATDWLQCKSRPGWLPAGPWLVPCWDVPDPSQLRPWLRLNGELMQSGSARDMVFGIGEQIAYLSRHVRLEPGDLLCTGSPAGFGSHHRRFLRPGDLVEAGIDGLGAQHVCCTR